MEQEPPPRTPRRSAASRRPGPRRPLDSRWWLPFAALVSVAVHLGIGIGGQQLGWFGPIETDSPQAGRAVQLTLSRAPVDRKQAMPPLPTSAKPEPVPTPGAAPAAVTPTPPPVDAPTEPLVARVPDAPERPASAATPVPPPIPLPVTSPEATPPPRRPLAARTTPGGVFRDRAPVPIRRGDRQGSRDIVTAAPRAARATDAPILSREPDGSGGGGSGSSLPTRPRRLAPDENAVAVLPGAGDNSAAGSAGGEGGGAGGGEGERAGAGRSDTAGSGLGISRGIPFGDRFGVANGSADGGGGTGRGAGGSGAFGASGRPRFTIGGARRTGGGPPVHVVYVVDVSGSMEEGNKIGKARDALRKALDELRPEDTFNIVTFSTRAHLFAPAMRPATAGFQSQGNLHLDLIRPNGATNISEALELAMAQEGATHIFLLSDGDPTEGIVDFDALRGMVRSRNGGRKRIITLALGQGDRFKGIELLRGIAGDNGGEFRYVNVR